MSITEEISNNIRNLYPGYFALVMATGIIGNSAKNAGMESLSRILFITNIFLYAILLIFFLIRLMFYFPNFRRDLKSFEKSPGFLTLVAGTAVFGVQLVTAAQKFSLSKYLWYFAIAAWLLIMISFLVYAITSSPKPGIERGFNGTWLLFIVSTQSIAILGNYLSGGLLINVRDILTFNLFFYLLGSSLYLILIPLIFYRLVFLTVNPGETDHSFWIDTGAAAICVVSGLTLIDNINSTGKLNDLLPFIKGMSYLLWITGTWWIPISIVIEAWRYLRIKVPAKYHPVQWSMIFVIGMYSLSSMKIGQITGMQGLISIGKLFLHISIILWIVIFVAMILSILHGLRSVTHLKDTNS
jgi:tellurite resistance protein TehA-like permease